jgi:ABC-type antimicrobial peptide transport system permease subunit
MARRYWPAVDPIGKFIRVMPEGRDYQIVGVVADAPINRIGEVPEPYIYTCWWQNPMGERTILIETAGNPAALGSAMRSVLDRPDLFTMDGLIRDATIEHRAALQLVGLLTALGLTLAAVGFYGVVAYGVTLRTREIGIRMAVGARDSDAAWLVGRSALLSAGCGILAGLPCSIAVVFSLRAILFGISPWYPPAFLGASAVLLVVALLAALLPAMRAARVDPLEALRCE